MWQGFLNVDSAPLPGVDVVWDLNDRPWPFASGAWALVVANHVIEHLDDLGATMRELHRILAPDGIAQVRVPHVAGWGAWNNPTHRHYFTRETLRYFEKGHHYSYAVEAGFSSVTCTNVFGLGKSARLNWLVNPLLNTNLYDQVLWKIIPCAEVKATLVK